MGDRDKGEVRRYYMHEIEGAPWMVIRASDHDDAMAAERERSDKRVEEREQGYAMEYEAFRLAHDEIVDGKDEQIATLKKALDAVIESEETSDEAADELRDKIDILATANEHDGQVIRELRERLSRSTTSAVKEAGNE